LTTSTPKVTPTWSFLLAHPAHLVAFGFGSGLSPKAPGTVGTLVAFPFYWLLQANPFYWIWIAAFLAFGVWACGVTGRTLGVHDHGGMVWDEIAAFLMVLPFAPVHELGMPLAFGLAFALFRLFDIWKPFPIGWLDARVPGGFGVMLDDVLAAGYAVACLLGVMIWL